MPRACKRLPIKPGSPLKCAFVRRGRGYALELEERVAERTAELDRERAKLRAISTGWPRVAYVGERAGRLYYCALARLLGFEAEELLHRPTDEVYGCWPAQKRTSPVWKPA
jgi:hypothetical protein